MPPAPISSVNFLLLLTFSLDSLGAEYCAAINLPFETNLNLFFNLLYKCPAKKTRQGEAKEKNLPDFDRILPHKFHGFVRISTAVWGLTVEEGGGGAYTEASVGGKTEG